MINNYRITDMEGAYVKFEIFLSLPFCQLQGYRFRYSDVLVRIIIKTRDLNNMPIPLVVNRIVERCNVCRPNIQCLFMFTVQLNSPTWACIYKHLERAFQTIQLIGVQPMQKHSATLSQLIVTWRPRSRCHQRLSSLDIKYVKNFLISWLLHCILKAYLAILQWTT